MKILITGGSGFIGTNLMQHFLEKKIDVLNIDSSPPKDNNHFYLWKKVNILDYDNFAKEVLLFNPDYIIHLAARVDLEGKTLDTYNANTLGVENIMLIINKLSNLKKIIITSSMLVCRTGYYPKNQTDYSPTTIYGKSKVMTEKIVWENKPQCDWAIIRPTSIWGPWFGVPYRNFFNMIISKKYFHIGNKSCNKTYGFVGNSIYQIEKILFSDTSDEQNKIFYIGDHPATNIEQWGNEIANELNIKIIKLPYFIVKIIAICGDALLFIGLHIPMTSFRLKNMTTNNVVDLANTYNIAPTPPFSRIDGIKKTLDWIKLFG
jgi:nucleoside-diphosphate-sugar epimerase